MPLVSKSFSDIITFSRGTNATYFDSAGVLKYAPNNAIRNNTMVGAVAGTPGTLPTNWAVSLDAGLTTNVIGIGTTNGIAYVDLQIVGTSTGTSYIFSFEPTTQISANGGQTWTWSAWLALVGGTLANVSAISADVRESNSGGSQVGVKLQTLSTPTASLSRQFGVLVLSELTTAFVQPRLSLSITSGAAIDITLRIGLPQLEIGNTAGPAIPTSGTAYYGPRFDYNPATLAARGLLIEEQRTNSIRNNTMQGAVAGTPGTMPTNWFISGLSGLTQQIVGTGNESGINYIDVKISGTTTSALFYVIRPESAVFVAATNGQTWTSSQYVRLVGGSLANLIRINNVIQYSDSGGVPLQYGVGDITPTSAALNTQRFMRTTAATNASIAFVVGYLQIEANSGAAIDITLRIGLPQLEQGAFATSVIPTTTTALTRAADVASVNTLSPWYNASAITLYTEFNTPVPTSVSAAAAVAGFDDGTANNRFSNFYSSNTSVIACNQVISGSPSFTVSGAAGLTLSNVQKVATRYQAGSYAMSVNGAAAVTDSFASAPPAVTTLRFGIRPGGTQANMWLRRVTVYPRGLANAELVSITS